MSIYRSKEDWIHIIQEAENSYGTLAQWCRDRGIHPKTYLKMRKEYQQAGLYAPTYQIAQEPYCFTYVDQDKQRIFFLYTKIVHSRSVSALLPYLTYHMDKEFFPNAFFVFLTANRKDLLVLRKTSVGISVTTSHKNVGCISWFDAHNRIRGKTLNLIKKMV